MAGKSSPWTRQTDGKNLGRFGEIKRKLAYLYLPLFLLIILWYLPIVGWKVHCGTVGVQLNAAGCFLSAAAQQWRPVSCTAVQLAATTVAVVTQWRPVCCTAVQLAAAATVAVVKQLRSWSRSAYILAHMSHFSNLIFAKINLQKSAETPLLERLLLYTYFPYPTENNFFKGSFKIFSMFLTDSKNR